MELVRAAGGEFLSGEESGEARILSGKRGSEECGAPLATIFIVTVCELI